MNQLNSLMSEYLGKLSKKKLRNIWKIPYVGGGVRAGHFPYVITESLRRSQKSFSDNKKITEDFPYVGGKEG